MRFSVAIPTFQRRGLVLDAITSAIAQDKPADEIIVVDEGSTDGTADAIQREFGPAVRLVRQGNRGVSAARNAAAALSRGDLIALLDDDDRWLPNHLETIEALARRHPAAVLISTCHNAWFGPQSGSPCAAASLRKWTRCYRSAMVSTSPYTGMVRHSGSRMSSCRSLGGRLDGPNHRLGAYTSAVGFR